MASYVYDIVIIGGGIIGLATALEFSRRFPTYRCAVVEKERDLGVHQTGHNNGVIHSGIYYAPGSLKAKNCVQGAGKLKQFCDQYGITYKLCGKVIVATSQRQVPALEELYRRGTANGVQGLEMIGVERLRELEPHVEGVKALYSAKTAIVDYVEVAKAYAAQFRENGGQICTGTRLRGVSWADGLLNLTTSRGDFRSRHLVNCAGLYADKVAEMAGARTDIRLIPFRGEYFMLSPEASRLVNGLIYPAPDPRLPFLGASFHRTIHGKVRAGPYTVLAFSREGSALTSLDPGQVLRAFTYGGFWKMVARYWKTGLQEFYRSISKRAFVKVMQRLVPDIEERHLKPCGSWVGIQAVGPSGTLAGDFCISETKNAIHVINAPSPGATASLAIGHYIADMAEKSFGFEA